MECGGGLVTKSGLTLVTPWTVAYQTPLSMGFSRQEYWSGLPFSSPGDLPQAGIKLRSPALQAVSCISGGFFTDWATRETPNPSCASWRPRQGDGLVSIQPTALRTRGLNGVSSSLSLKVLEPEAWMSLGRECKNVSSQAAQIHLPPFCSCESHKGFEDAYLHWKE